MVRPHHDLSLLDFFLAWYDYIYIYITNCYIYIYIHVFFNSKSTKIVKTNGKLNHESRPFLYRLISFKSKHLYNINTCIFILYIDILYKDLH